MKLVILSFLMVIAANIHAATIDTQYIDDSVSTILGTKTTTDIAEGTNLYFTNQRALDATASAYAAAAHNHSGVYEPANANIQSHISSTSNPHSVTASQVGLGNVTNDAQVKKSEYTAKGDILVGTGAGTYSALGSSTNGYVLTLDSAQGSGVKWAAIPSTVSGAKENKTLVAQDITNQYWDLSVECKANTVHFYVEGGGEMIEDVDYSVSIVSNVTRISFLNDLATGGQTALVATSKVSAKCLY